MTASFPSLLQSFFTDRLLRQRQASPHTVAGYRDSFRLLLKFAQERLHKGPSQLRIEDLDAPFVGLFLDHLESTRKNSARTRNVRLGAIHSFSGTWLWRSLRMPRLMAKPPLSRAKVGGHLFGRF